MLLLLDGQSHNGTAGIAHKYTTRNETAVTWSIVPEGRFGNCLKRVSTSSLAQSGYLGVVPFATRTGLWTPQTGGVCGFAIKVDDLARVSGGEASGVAYGLLVIEEPMDPIGGGDGYHLRVDLNANGTFTLRRRHSAGDAVIANSIRGLTSNTWMYVECKWLIHETAGSFEIRVNTIPVLTYAGDTRADAITTFGYWTSVRLFSVNSTPSSLLVLRVSDLYLADLTGSGADVRDFLGDGTIRTIFPNGPGLATDWTPTPTAPNWEQVNDQPAPDGDTTYVTASTPGARDVYQFQDIPAGSIVKAAQLVILAQKEDEGTVTLTPIVGQSGLQYDGVTQGVASTSYDHYLTQPYDRNPATGVAWTDTEINAGQWGVLKVI